jgi:alpha-maltose-1-phosphate synthase
VKALLEAEADYLKGRLGATRFTLPKFPVIPLGIDSPSFFYTESDKAMAREALGIRPDETVILFVGRLSFHAKANPAPLYQALEKAKDNKNIVVAECGWFANDFIKSAFEEAAQLLAPGIRRIVLDGRIAENRQKAWGSADIFASLTDNLQETFGITPVEAMAAGLPCVVTDWDGYRETVRHGIDGFRIRTFQPKPGFGAELGKKHALEADNYDHYCGLTSQLVGVDFGESVDAFRALIHNPALCRKMGEEGRKRARNVFDWAKIIPIYQELWEDLAEERRSHPDFSDKPSRHAWPSRMEPFSAFETYATTTIGETTPIRRRPDSAPEAVREMLALKTYSLAGRLLPKTPNMIDFLYLIPVDEAVTAQQLITKTGLSISEVMNMILLGIKLGFLASDGSPRRG